MKQKKWLAGLAAALLILAGGAWFLWYTGFFSAATSLEGMQRYIAHFSPYSELVFFILQLVSVILAPIPSNITAAAGGLLFGVWPSFLLTAAAVTIGSTVVFLLARIIGKRFVGRFVSEKVSTRYLEVIQRKRDVFLILVFLFPFFPDDLICILAGLTDISLVRFTVIVALTRHWGLLVACAIGGNAMSIPIWGMVLIGLGGLALFLLGMKYGDRIEEQFIERFRKP